jgi:hypothetical protein
MRIWNGDFGRPEPQDSAEGKPKILRVMIQSCLAVSCGSINQQTWLQLVTHTPKHTRTLTRSLSGTGRRLGGLTPHSHTHTLNFPKPAALISCLLRLKEEGMGRAGWLGLTPRQRLDSAFGLQGAHEALRGARRSHSIRSELQDCLILVIFERSGSW